MRIKAVKRVNNYIEEGVFHRPKQSISPYEKTLDKLMKSPQVARQVVKPLELKFCKHCCFSIKLSSNGALMRSQEYPSAEVTCKNCAADICKKCLRKCEKCQSDICFVCNNVVFEEHDSINVCPDCN